MAEEGSIPMPPSGVWTGRNLAIIIGLLVVTNAVTGVSVFFLAPQPGVAALVVYHPWAGSERDLFLPVLDDFTARTGIEVKDRTFRQEDLQTILPSQFENGRTPADVIFMASGFIREWGTDGHAIELSALVDESKYLAGTLTPVQEGDNLYGAAYTMKVKPGFWYNASFFEEKGWNQNPANYDEFVSLLQAIAATGIVPIVSGDTVGWPLSDVAEHFIATYGGAQMHKDLTSGAKAFTDADVKAIFADKLVPLLQAGYFDDLVEWTAGVQDLDDKNNALYFQGSWLPTMSQTSDESNMRAMPLPGGVASQGIIGPVDYVFIPTYTTRMPEAQALLTYLISQEGQEKQIEQGGHFATQVDADPSVAPPTYSGDLIAGKELLPDLDDTIGGTFQTTFWSQLQLLWAAPSQLDSVLSTIEGARP